MEINEITGKIIEEALKVHSLLGPGLFEEVYKKALAAFLKRAGLKVRNEVAVPVTIDDLVLDCGYRIDLLVESKVLVELKAIERISRLHRSEVLSYLKLTHIEVGLLINFNTPHLAQGISRIVNNYRGPRPGAGNRAHA